MIILGIAISHNSSAALMIDGEVVGLIQEERFTKVKNQSGFPLLAIKALIKEHLNDDKEKIDEVVYGSTLYNPYFFCLDKYSNYNVHDHITEMKEVWYPHFYENKPLDGQIWRDQIKRGDKLNKFHNLDFSFLNNELSLQEAIDHFCNIEIFNPLKKLLPGFNNFKKIDQHTCHAYYALYGGEIDRASFKDTLVVTADAMGDKKNWSISTVNENGELNRIAYGDEFLVARIYKFCTLILGMKPNEHEYKVMGLSAYSTSSKHIKAVEDIFFDILDFKKGSFISTNPLIDSYFDLKNRLEGHRFDNIAAGMQNWTSKITSKWIDYWIKKTGKKILCFSGGLAMNIKTNGEFLKNENIRILSVPASGGDESNSAGACFAVSKANNRDVKPINSPYLGGLAKFNNESCYSLIDTSKVSEKDFAIEENFDNKKVAQLLNLDFVVARCSGKAEFGARALGNRSILANPKNVDNVKKINESIKNRDFWMPFTPSILEEHANKYLQNPKRVTSPYMTIGFETTDLAKEEIPACLHLGDYSARPQFVKKELNSDYWDLINQFFHLTNIPCLLNTSLNLHGEPMNYTIEDSVRTLSMSSLDFLILPDKKLLYKQKQKEIVKKITTNHSM
jgi:carbamoyltransferase